jgi:hypothetical protein
MESALSGLSGFRATQNRVNRKFRKRQVNWLRQMVAMGVQFVLHVDGKHKVHYGR